MGLRKYNKVFLQKREMIAQLKEMSKKTREDWAGNKDKKVSFHILILHKIQSKTPLIMKFLKSKIMQLRILKMKNHFNKLITMKARTFYKK